MNNDSNAEECAQGPQWCVAAVVDFREQLQYLGMSGEVWEW